MKMVKKMESGQYREFVDLPLANGKARTPSQAFKGQMVVVHASELALDNHEGVNPANCRTLLAYMAIIVDLCKPSINDSLGWSIWPNFWTETA